MFVDHAIRSYRWYVNIDSASGQRKHARKQRSHQMRPIILPALAAFATLMASDALAAPDPFVNPYPLGVAVTPMRFHCQVGADYSIAVLNDSGAAIFRDNKHSDHSGICSSKLISEYSQGKFNQGLQTGIDYKFLLTENIQGVSRSFDKLYHVQPYFDLNFPTDAGQLQGIQGRFISTTDGIELHANPGQGFIALRNMGGMTSGTAARVVGEPNCPSGKCELGLTFDYDPYPSKPWPGSDSGPYQVEILMDYSHMLHVEGLFFPDGHTVRRDLMPPVDVSTVASSGKITLEADYVVSDVVVFVNGSRVACLRGLPTTLLGPPALLFNSSLGGDTAAVARFSATPTNFFSGCALPPAVPSFAN